MTINTKRFLGLILLCLPVIIFLLFSIIIFGCWITFKVFVGFAVLAVIGWCCGYFGVELLLSK